MVLTEEDGGYKDSKAIKLHRNSDLWKKQNSLKRRVPTAGYVRAFFTQWLKYNGMFPLICVINQLSFHFHSEKESMMRVVVLGLDYLENI